METSSAKIIFTQQAYNGEMGNMEIPVFVPEQRNRKHWIHTILHRQASEA